MYLHVLNVLAYIGMYEHVCECIVCMCIYVYGLHVLVCVASIGMYLSVYARICMYFHPLKPPGGPNFWWKLEPPPKYAEQKDFEAEIKCP